MTHRPLRRRRRELERRVLAVLFAVCLLVALAGAPYFARTWSLFVDPVDWNWPGPVLWPTWTLLHVLPALAAWWVWRIRSELRMPALMLFGLQLLLNALWPFAMLTAGTGWAWPMLLSAWFTLAVTIALFFRVHTPSGVLMLPYLVWVSFALAHNL